MKPFTAFCHSRGTHARYCTYLHNTTYCKNALHDRRGVPTVHTSATYLPIQDRRSDRGDVVQTSFVRKCLCMYVPYDAPFRQHCQRHFFQITRRPDTPARRRASRRATRAPRPTTARKSKCKHWQTDQGAMTLVGAARRAEIVEEGCGRCEWGDIRSGRWEQWTGLFDGS